MSLWGHGSLNDLVQLSGTRHLRDVYLNPHVFLVLKATRVCGSSSIHLAEPEAARFCFVD